MTNMPPDTSTTLERLNHLPPRTAAPFVQLLKTGQLSADIVEIVLNAGTLSGDTSRLIGFAAGFLGMRAQGIPVDDVIKMAQAQQRRINLSWSVKRWMQEHDRLAQAEALARLSQHNTRYKLSAYRKHLPKRFPGYLIPSSQRLGMEGLRQRHCVASYHTAVKSGTCAIVAVFIEKQRWTVELKLADNRETPLRIEQIKTRYNKLPTAPITEKIHEVLGIPMPKAPEPSSADNTHRYLDNLRRLLPLLRAAGVQEVSVSFDGSCDSGAIHDITYEPSNTADVQNAPVQYIRSDRSFDQGQWSAVVTEEQTTVGVALDQLTYDYLERTDVDWYNDDGGFGTLTIRVTEGIVELGVHTRSASSELAYSDELDIITGDEI